MIHNTDEAIRRSCTCMLDRFEASAHSLGENEFIDMKFHIVSGRDFTGESPIHRKDLIYGWTQGRALESLARHSDYFRAQGDTAMAERCEKVLVRLAATLRRCAANHDGHLYFIMTPQGDSLGPVEGGATNFADFFFGKGLLCASATMGDDAMREEALVLLDKILVDISEERFISGQQIYDPKNPAAMQSAMRLAETPRMLALSAIADLVRLVPEPSRYARQGMVFLDYLLQKHVFRKDGKVCFCEYIDSENKLPVVESTGEILCDPGHGMEFIGHGTRMIRMIQERCPDIQTRPVYTEVLPELYFRMFDDGFQTSCWGVVKCIDAVTGRVINSDMPWWGVPESMRAAKELSRLVPAVSEELQRRYALAETALFEHYLQPNGFAAQMRDKRGKVVPVIPAVPDADPGYHLNLCLM